MYLPMIMKDKIAYVKIYPDGYNKGFVELK